jgi:hypothetical protein
MGVSPDYRSSVRLLSTIIRRAAAGGQERTINDELSALRQLFEHA